MSHDQSKTIHTIKKVMPAVVSIVISKHLEDIKKEFNDLKKKNTDEHPSALHIPPNKIDANGMVEVGGGSGFIVDGKTGIILTNKHVVDEQEADYTVITSDGMHYPATIEARDPINDIAILRITPQEKLSSISLGDSSDLKLGQTVFAFGNALGMFQNTVSKGIISGLSRAVSAQSDSDSPMEDLRGLIQTDAAINPGNSGGPLVNFSGKVIGINVAVVAGAHNISFAIPVHTAKKDLVDLKKFGRIRTPLLGVRYLILNETLQKKLHTSTSYGAFITKENSIDYAIAPHTPAAEAGMLENDILLEWNGKKITEKNTIQDFLETSAVGDEVVFKILRNDEEINLKVILTERK